MHFAINAITYKCTLQYLAINALISAINAPYAKEGNKCTLNAICRMFCYPLEHIKWGQTLLISHGFPDNQFIIKHPCEAKNFILILRRITFNNITACFLTLLSSSNLPSTRLKNLSSSNLPSIKLKNYINSEKIPE